MKKTLLGSFAILTLLAGTGNATFIDNGDFEDLTGDESGKIFGKTLSDLNPGNWDVYSTLPGGWYAGEGDAGIEVQFNSVDNNPTNNHYVELDSHAQNPANSSMYQKFTTYDYSPFDYFLTFDYRSRTTNGPNNGIRVSLDPSATNLANPIAELETGNQTWTTYSYNLGILKLGLEYTLGFTAYGGHNTYGGFLDNVSITAASVPEPATMLLFGTGLIGLAGVARRKKK